MTARFVPGLFYFLNNPLINSTNRSRIGSSSMIKPNIGMILPLSSLICAGALLLTAQTVPNSFDPVDIFVTRTRLPDLYWCAGLFKAKNSCLLIAGLIDLSSTGKYCSSPPAWNVAT